MWWIRWAKSFAASVPAAGPVVPTIIQVVSVYQEDGSTRFQLTKPENYHGPTYRMDFKPGPLDHERALTAYDRYGVSAIIQLEPGDANVLACLGVAQKAFGHHPCVIGYGLDAEWYRTKESYDKAGIPLSDDEVRQWVWKVRSCNPDHTFFIKHWRPSHLPPTYRHPNLWFLSDSQDFPSLGKFMEDFRYWQHACRHHTVGYQYGYESDRQWWSRLSRPTVEISLIILNDIPGTRFLFWVDFTANSVPIGTAGHVVSTPPSM
jgi:hypothetical protein